MRTLPPSLAALDDVRGAHELRAPAVGGREVELLGRARLHDLAVAHERDAVGERERLLAVVRHEQHGHARRAQDARRPRRAARAQQRVDGAPGLVEQHERGPGASARASATRCCWPPDSSSGKRWPEVAEADEVEHLGDAAAARSRRGRPKPTFAATSRCGNSA